MEITDREERPAGEYGEDKDYMVSGINLNLLKKIWKGSLQSSACSEYTRNAVAFRVPCALILFSGAPIALEQHDLLLEEQ